MRCQCLNAERFWNKWTSCTRWHLVYLLEWMILFNLSKEYTFYRRCDKVNNSEWAIFYVTWNSVTYTSCKYTALFIRSHIRFNSACEAGNQTRDLLLGRNAVWAPAVGHNRRLYSNAAKALLCLCWTHSVWRKITVIYVEVTCSPSRYGVW